MLSETIMNAQISGEFDWPKITPDGIGDYIETLGHSVNSSAEHILMGLLAIIPGLIGPGGKLQVRKNYSEPSSLFSICLADPGAGKSPAHSIIANELSKANLSHLVIDRYTQNGLFDHMLENSGVAIMFNAEMGMFLENVLKKQSEGTGERQLLCKLYDCTAWSKVCGNQDRLEVTHPVPVTGGYSQPDTFIQTYLNLMERNDGFPDRFLVETPKPISLHEEEIDEWEEVLSATYSHVSLAETFDFIYKYHSSDERCYFMSQEALEILRKFSNNISDKLNEQWQNRSHYSGRISKDKRTALRLALNLHVLYHTLDHTIKQKSLTKIPSEISLETMEMAIALTRHFAKQREIFEQCCHSVSSSQGEESKQTIVDESELAHKILFNHPGPFVNPRLFFRNTVSHTKRPTQRELERVFSVLEEGGYGKFYVSGSNKAFLKYPPESLPTDSFTDEEMKMYAKTFQLMDTKLSSYQEKNFLGAHPHKDILLHFITSTQRQYNFIKA